MEDTPLEGADFEGDPGLVGDIAEGSSQVEGVSEEAPRQYVEIDDPDNRYVRVKVDGEDVEVPFSEAIKGYSREAHFTRSMQEAKALQAQAEWGLRVQAALDEDPQLALEMLARRYGLDQRTAAAPEEPEPEFADPLEAAIYQERQARIALEERIAQRESDEMLSRAVDDLRRDFNVSQEDLRAVVQTAYQNRLGPEAFPMIYKTMVFDRLQARMQAQGARTQQEQTEAQRRQAAAAQATQMVTTGNGATNLTAHDDTIADRHITVREALEAALELHGVPEPLI